MMVEAMDKQKVRAFKVINPSFELSAERNTASEPVAVWKVRPIEVKVKEPLSTVSMKAKTGR